MLSLQQWQTPTKHPITSRYTTTNTTPCYKCQLICNEAVCGKHHTLYGSESQTFCISCWDEESWDCPHCRQLPDDNDCISCHKCGQWTHNHCDGLHIDATKEYLCNRCKYSGDVIDKLVLQKNACATKLTVVENELAEKVEDATTQHKNEITQLSNKHVAQLDTLKQRKEAVYNKQLRVMKGKYDKCKVYIAKQLENLNKKHQAEYQQAVAEKIKVQGELESTKASLMARSATVKEMKALASEKNKAVRELNVANSRNHSGNQEIHFLKNQVSELKKQLSRSQNNGKKNNKRSRECGQMLEDMHRLVKKYRARWNYNPPSTLAGIDLMLWQTYRCKTDGSSFSSDKLLCEGIPPVWKSLQQTLGEVKTYHIKSTMENKK